MKETKKYLIKNNGLRRCYVFDGDTIPQTKKAQIWHIILNGHDDTVVLHPPKWSVSRRFDPLWLVNLECKIQGFGLLFVEWRALLSRQPWTREGTDGKQS